MAESVPEKRKRRADSVESNGSKKKDRANRVAEDDEVDSSHHRRKESRRSKDVDDEQELKDEESRSSRRHKEDSEKSKTSRHHNEEKENEGSSSSRHHKDLDEKENEGSSSSRHHKDRDEKERSRREKESDRGKKDDHDSKRRDHDAEISRKKDDKESERGSRRRGEDDTSDRRERERSRKSSRREYERGSSRRSRSSSRRRDHRERDHRSSRRSRSRSRSRDRRDRDRHHSRRSRSRESRRSRDRKSRRESRRHSKSRSRSTSKSASKRGIISSTSSMDIPPADVQPSTNSTINPSISQLMQQYPTLSLQDMLSKMHSSHLSLNSTAALTKPARDLYIGNLPANVTAPQLQEYLGTIIQQVGLSLQPGNPILSTWISADGHFAFCEMRTVEECNLALLLNQLPLLGQPMKFGRPRGFAGPPQPMPVVSARTQTALVNLGCTPNPMWFAGGSAALGIQDGSTPNASAIMANAMALNGAIGGALNPVANFAPNPNVNICSVLENLKIELNERSLVMSNIPKLLKKEQISQLAHPFGTVTSFSLIVDPLNNQSTGCVVFEYEDEIGADMALEGLRDLKIGDYSIGITRGNDEKLKTIEINRAGVSGVAHSKSDVEPTTVLRLGNIIAEEDLKDDEEYSDIKQDIEEECSKHGSVLSVEVPRPLDDAEVFGTGKAFVQFNDVDSAAAALKALTGRKFGGKVVQVSFMSLTQFEVKDFS